MPRYDELQSALQQASLEAFRRSADRHRNETIYCAALYTSSGYEYICDTVSTMEGLKTVAEKYVAEGHNSNLVDAMRDLKWSPCDSPYHLENEDLFLHCSHIIEDIWKSVTGGADEESDRVYRELHDVFVGVLRVIRASDIFDSRCIITLLAGDQSHEARIVNSEEINPPDVAQALIRDVNTDAAHLARLRANRWPTDHYYEP
jgi:hypothetical protein